MSVILSLIAVYNLYLYSIDRTRPKFILSIFVISVILSILFARYDADTFVYVTKPVQQDNAQVSQSRTNKYRVMSAPVKYNTYNLYLIKSANDKYNKLLQTDINTIYTIGEYIEVTDMSKSVVRQQSAMMAIGHDDAQSDFDYNEYIFYKYKAQAILRLYENKNHSLQEYDELTIAEHIKLYKNSLENKLYEYHNVNNFELIAGIIYGRDITLSRALNDELRSSGLSHIAVMSGYNLLIMLAIIYFAFKYIARALQRLHLHVLQHIYVRTLFAILLISVLPISNDWDAPIMRAYIFVVLATLYLLAGRVENYKYILAMTAIIILYISPHAALNDIGLHLSLLAVTSLVYFEKYIYNWLRARIHLGEILSRYLSVTIAAQVLTAPYIIYVFGNYNALSIFANLLVVAILPIITIAGIIETILLALNMHMIERVFYVVTETLSNYIIMISNLF